MTQKTPVLLLTGYLGSGKTTLLNRILTNSKGIKFGAKDSRRALENVPSIIETGTSISPTGTSFRLALPKRCSKDGRYGSFRLHFACREARRPSRLAS